nr:hypothetical protein [Tanacetum cinerariifolium]
MRRVGKGFSGVETPLFEEPSSPPQQPHVRPSAPTQGEAFPATFQQVLDTCSALLRHVEHLEHDNVAQRLEIVKLKARVKKLEKTDKVKSSKLRRLRKVGVSRQVESSDDMEDVFNQGRMMNKDEGIELEKDAEIAESEGRQADKQAEIYNIDLDHSSKVLSMQEDDPEVQDVVEVVATAKLITEVVTATASQVSAISTTIPAASATIPAAKPSIPAAAPTVVAAYTRRRKRVIIRDLEEELPLKTPAETPKQEIDRDHDGFNKDVDWDAAMDHVNQKSSRMTYAQICPIFQARFDENIRFLFKSRGEMEAKDQEIIKSINETPAQKAAKRRKLTTPLARKVPVVDYQIVLIDNKPRWKLLTSCGVHVITLSTVQLFLLVERRYPLSRFTLEQLVNVARLQVEEESEMSLELLSEELSVAKQKLMLLDNAAERRLMLLSQDNAANSGVKVEMDGFVCGNSGRGGDDE